MGTREQIEKDVIATAQAYADAEAELEQIRKLVAVSTASEPVRRAFRFLTPGLQKLRKAIDRRAKGWKIFRNTIAQRANVVFIATLHKRGYSGKIDFHHDVSDQEGQSRQGRLILRVGLWHLIRLSCLV